MRTAKMTRAHFELIAATIHELPIAPATVEIVAREFARKLKATNERFAEERFLKAAIRKPRPVAAAA